MPARWALALGVLLAAAGTVQASSVRGWATNDVMQIVRAMQYYQEHMGTLPTDICDKRGRPLLSWRVRLLPFVEDPFLWEKFKLDESWNGPHNRKLIAQIPKVYRDPWGTAPTGRTCYLRPRGEGTLFPRDQRSLPAWPAGKIVLVEADDAHAVIWTKPQDLDYDQARPHAGLARRWDAGWLDERGALVGLSGGDVRMVLEGTDPEALRSLISPDPDAPPPAARPWYEWLFHPSWRKASIPALLIGLCAVAGAVVIAGRAFRGRAISAGEFLWLALGVSQALYWLAFVLCCRVEQLPSWRGTRDGGTGFWVLARLGAAAVCVVAAVRLRSAPAWPALFSAAAGCLALVAVGTVSGEPRESVLESLLTASAPVVLYLTAFGALALTLSGGKDAAVAGSGWRHRAGLVVCMLPLALWMFGCAQGWTKPQPLIPFVTIRD